MLKTLGVALVCVAVGGCGWTDTTSRSVTCRTGTWNTDSVFAQSEIRASPSFASFPDSSAARVGQLDERGLAVFMARWHAPNAGALLLVDCTGATLAMLPTSYIDSVTTWVGAGTRPTLLAIFTSSAQATGFAESRFSLALATDAVFRVVLDLPTTLESDGPGHPSAKRYTVRFADSVAVEVQEVGASANQGQRWMWSSANSVMNLVPPR